MLARQRGVGRGYVGAYRGVDSMGVRGAGQWG